MPQISNGRAMTLKGQTLILPLGLRLPLLSTRLGNFVVKQRGRELHGGYFKIVEDDGKTLLLQWMDCPYENPVLWEIQRSRVT